MNSYDLSRNWFNFSFENPEIINPAHTALYFFAIEHCNRLGWKEKFGLPTTMAKEALGIKSYNTYIKIFNDLINFGFIKLIEKSKNQYSANIIALLNNDKALDKPLDKAMIKHLSKQSESTCQSIDSIIKQINNKQYNKKQIHNLARACEEHLEELNDVSKKITIEQFDKFWKIYPRKTHKESAEEKWRILSKMPNNKQPEFRTIIRAVKAQSKQEQWQDKKYIPNPAKWIFRRMWDDEVIDKSLKKKVSSGSRNYSTATTQTYNDGKEID